MTQRSEQTRTDTTVDIEVNSVAAPNVSVVENQVVDDKVPATSQFLNANLKKPKVASGYDDLPKRDSIGERQKKHEDLGDYYKQAENQRAAKANIYSRESAAPSLPEETLEGKHHIISQIEKNRGLTRRGNKDKKNPRKIYRLKLQGLPKKYKGPVRILGKLTGSCWRNPLK